jgi:hypothetical protein
MAIFRSKDHVLTRVDQVMTDHELMEFARMVKRHPLNSSVINLNASRFELLISLKQAPMAVLEHCFSLIAESDEQDQEADLEECENDDEEDQDDEDEEDEEDQDEEDEEYEDDEEDEEEARKFKVRVRRAP